MKSRSTLEEYFRKGKIPKESEFADLIDSVLIQDEDSMLKLPNDPLSVKATGPEEALLNFYRVEQGENKPTWQLKQKPGNKLGRRSPATSSVFRIRSTVQSRLRRRKGRKRRSPNAMPSCCSTIMAISTGPASAPMMAVTSGSGQELQAPICSQSRIMAMSASGWRRQARA